MVLVNYYALRNNATSQTVNELRNCIRAIRKCPTGTTLHGCEIKESSFEKQETKEIRGNWRRR